MRKQINVGNKHAGKPDDELKVARFTFVSTEGDRARIHRAAKACGLTDSKFARRVLMGRVAEVEGCVMRGGVRMDDEGFVELRTETDELKTEKGECDAEV